MGLIDVFLIITAGLIALGWLFVAVVSLKEEERRASTLSFLFAVLFPVPYLVVALSQFEGQGVAGTVLLVVSISIPVIFMLPTGKTLDAEPDTPSRQIDERDIMFSRKDLIEGSDQYNAYYERRPDRRRLDDTFRNRPGILTKGASQYDPISFSAADASFRSVNAYHAILDEERLTRPSITVDSDAISRFVKEWMLRLGAVSVGITRLEGYHLYSTIGRGERYGESIELGHSHAVALTVEMDKYFVDRAPQGPTIMESARQYLNSGTLAVQLAEFFRLLGYSARAHIDGSYRVVCPLVARDAGLGDIGRVGLLMTPELGPRVRIAVVTTELELIPDQRKRDETVIDFCTRCKKCADACPSQAISFDDRSMIDGVNRWQINSEACYTFWCAVGTDCARCISVCPYSHPDNAMHNFVRSGIKRSVLFRQMALRFDDLFYGRKPIPLSMPEWIADAVPHKNDDAAQKA